MAGVMNRLRNLDAYPKINDDFYSRTLSGGLITLVPSIVMLILFFSELRLQVVPTEYTDVKEHIIQSNQVIFTEQHVEFLHLLTNVCAIVGGIFTVYGIIDSFIYHGQRRERKNKKKKTREEERERMPKEIAAKTFQMLVKCIEKKLQMWNPKAISEFRLNEKWSHISYNVISCMVQKLQKAKAGEEDATPRPAEVISSYKFMFDSLNSIISFKYEPVRNRFKLMTESMENSERHSAVLASKWIEEKTIFKYAEIVFSSIHLEARTAECFSEFFIDFVMTLK